MPSFVGFGGAHKELQGGTSGQGTAVGAGGSWRSVRGIWVGSGGVWRRVFDQFSYSLNWTSLISFTFSPSSATSSVLFRRDGDILLEVDNFAQIEPGATDWVTPRNSTIGDDYDVRLTVNSGAAPTSGNSVGVWLQGNANYQWDLTRSGVGSVVGNWTLAIRRRSDNVEVVSHTFDVSCTVDLPPGP